MRYALRRLFNVIPLLFVVTLLSFSMLKLLPGDPVTTILGNGASDPVKVAALNKELGLDRPFHIQYLNWAGNFVRGNMGSLFNGGTGEKVRDLIVRNYPITFELALWALLLALLFAVPLGVLSGYKAGSRVDRGINFVNYAALASPAFVVGPLLIFFIGLQFHWLPVGQYVSWSEGPIDHIRSMILPAITLAITQIPNFTRILRTDMESTLKEDFITLAKSKGLSDKRILFRHAFRPSSLTLLTVAGVNLGGLLGGSVIVERLYNLQGLGFLLIGGINNREYILVLGVVTIITSTIVLIATAIDICYGVVDPRVRVAR
jgi:peptide/nickel transport system permease protein